VFQAELEGFVDVACGGSGCVGGSGEGEGGGSGQGEGGGGGSSGGDGEGGGSGGGGGGGGGIANDNEDGDASGKGGKSNGGNGGNGGKGSKGGEEGNAAAASPSQRLLRAGWGTVPLCDAGLERSNAMARRHFPHTVAALASLGAFQAGPYTAILFGTTSTLNPTLTLCLPLLHL